MTDKDPTQKLATEMTFPEFHNWASGYCVLAIGEGKPLRDALYMVLTQAALNEVFGGKKPVEPTPIPSQQILASEFVTLTKNLLATLYNVRDKSKKKSKDYYFVKGAIYRSTVDKLRKLVGQK